MRDDKSAAVLGLLLYVTTLESVVTSLFSDDEGISRWQGAIGSIWPILVLCGTLPVGAIDRVISLHPRQIPPRIVREAALQALSAGPLEARGELREGASPSRAPLLVLAPTS